MPTRKCMKCYRHFKTRVPYEGHKCPLRGCTCNGCLPKRRNSSKKRGRIPRFSKPTISEILPDKSPTKKKDVNERTTFNPYVATAKSSGNPSVAFYTKNPLQMIMPVNQIKVFSKKTNDMTKQQSYHMPIYLRGTGAQLGFVTITASTEAESSFSPVTCQVSDKTSKIVSKPLSSLENVNTTYKEAIHISVPKPIDWTVNVKKPKVEEIPTVKCITSSTADTKKLPQCFLPRLLESDIGKSSGCAKSLDSLFNWAEVQKQQQVLIEKISMRQAKNTDFSVSPEILEGLKSRLKKKTFDLMIRDIYHFHKLYSTLPEWIFVPIYVACNGNFLEAAKELENLACGSTSSLRKKLHTYCKGFITRHTSK